MLRLNVHPLQHSLVWFPSPASVLFGNMRFFLTNKGSFHLSRSLIEALCKCWQTLLLCPAQICFSAKTGRILGTSRDATCSKTTLYYAFFRLRQTPFQVVSIPLCQWRWQELQRGMDLILVFCFCMLHRDISAGCKVVQGQKEAESHSFHCICTHNSFIRRVCFIFSAGDLFLIIVCK